MRQSKTKTSRFDASPKILNAKSQVNTLYPNTVQCVSSVIQKKFPANPDNFAPVIPRVWGETKITEVIVTHECTQIYRYK